MLFLPSSSLVMRWHNIIMNFSGSRLLVVIGIIVFIGVIIIAIAILLIIVR